MENNEQQKLSVFPVVLIYIATLKQIDEGSGSDSYNDNDPRDKAGIFNEMPSPSSKNDESNNNEFKTIRTRNDMTERQGSKELKIKM